MTGADVRPSPSPPAQLWAVARLTLQEAARRKIFTVLLLFAVVVLSSATFFPMIDDLEARLRLIQLWSLRATVLFSAIVAVFVAGHSLPSDMDQRRIYTLATKPLSKIVLFLGRALGFALLLGIFLAIMGSVTVAYLRLSSAFGGPAFPELKAEPRLAPAVVESKEGVPHPDKKETYLLRESGADLRFRFRGLDPDSFPATIRGEGTLTLNDESGYRFSGTVVVEVSGSTRQEIQAYSATPFSFLFPRTAISKDGEVEIRISRQDPRLLVAGSPDSVVLIGGSEPYEWNFAKGMLLLYFHSLILLSVTLMASAFLSAPVSIVLGVFVFLVGLVHGFIAEGVRDIDRHLRARDEAIRTGRPAPRNPEGIPVGILQTSSALSRVALNAVGDYRTFDFTPHLIHDLAVPPSDLGRAGLDMLLRCGLLLGLGSLVMRFKEFAT